MESVIVSAACPASSFSYFLWEMKSVSSLQLDINVIFQFEKSKRRLKLDLFRGSVANLEGEFGQNVENQQLCLHQSEATSNANSGAVT